MVTMKKLIELDAALDALREVTVPAKDIGFGDESTDGYNDGIDMAVTVVNGLPTVDAVPIRHGRWINGKCDKCGGHAPFWAMATTYYPSKFCPHCGAKMYEKDGDNHDG